MITFGWRQKLPVILQTESSECGLACLAMIAGFHGQSTTLNELRSRFNISMTGLTLTHLTRVADTMGLASRSLRLEIDDLRKLRLPCVLHWDFKHFVVLRSVQANGALLVHDPQTGMRLVSPEDVTRSFTGIAVELWPKPNFEKRRDANRVRLRDLIGSTQGIMRSLSWILMLAFGLELFSLLTPLYMQWVIDNVIVTGDYELLTTLSLAFALLIIVQQLVALARSWSISYFNAVISTQWQANIFNHLLSVPLQFFERRHMGDVVSRFGSADTIQRTLSSAFLETVLDGIMGLLILFVMFIYSPLLALVAVASSVLYLVIRWSWYRPLRTATEELIIFGAKQQSYFLETIRGVRALKLFSKQHERRSIWLSHFGDQVNAGLHTERLALIYRLTNGIVFGLENILTVWIGARAVLSGEFSLGALTAFLAFKGQFATRAGNLVDKFIDVKMLRLQAERLADIVLTEAEVLEGCGETTGRSDDTSVEVSNLSFRYSDYEPFVLRDLSFKVESGECVAIVGASGCGKTTLVGLLLGILNPTSGSILIAGDDVGRLGIGAMREKIGSVLQDDALFTGTVADNISFFDPDRDFSWIEECARRACIHDEIMAMSTGYNALIGDMGTVLSGGQKQRVLLARALYKRPKILVLDEATSHLDTACEARVSEQITSLRITRILIAHRPETIASADRAIHL